MCFSTVLFQLCSQVHGEFIVNVIVIPIILQRVNRGERFLVRLMIDHSVVCVKESPLWK
jgi:hypothetical protein